MNESSKSNERGGERSFYFFRFEFAHSRYKLFCCHRCRIWKLETCSSAFLLFLKLFHSFIVPHRVRKIADDEGILNRFLSTCV